MERTPEDEIAHLKEKLGKQGNELGEMRRLTETLLAQQEKKDPVTKESFQEDPIAAMEQLVAQKIKPVEDYVAYNTHEKAKSQLESKHADYEDVVNSAEFQDWVLSSGIRQTAWKAATQGEIGNAIELLDEYKQMDHGSTVNAAQTSTSTASSDGGHKSKKTYSALELQDLYINHPDRYRELAPEIYRAYREGRVAHPGQ